VVSLASLLPSCCLCLPALSRLVLHLYKSQLWCCRADPVGHMDRVFARVASRSVIVSSSSADSSGSSGAHSKPLLQVQRAHVPFLLGLTGRETFRSSCHTCSQFSHGDDIPTTTVLECQVIISILIAAAHTRTLEKIRALGSEKRVFSRVCRFLLGG
jgi:hypothetical protein